MPQTLESRPGRVVRVDRRTQLLRAAAELFAGQGYAATSIDAIGARAGVSGPAVYRHFSGKQDLLLTLLGGAVETGMADIEDAVREGESADDNLAALVAQVVRHAIADRQVIGLLYAQNGELDANGRGRVEALRDRVFETWARTLKAARPALGDAEVAIYVRAGLSVVGGIALRAPARAEGEIEQLYTRMLLGLLTA